MTLTQLEYIVALADLQSFSKAADFCCVSQPSLSMQVQKLEDELNMTLFNRKAKPLQPTSEARDILAKARAILNESNSILSLSKGWANQVSGFVSIGVIPTIAPYLMPKFLADFQLKFPELSISISETTTATIKKGIHHWSTRTSPKKYIRDQFASLDQAEALIPQKKAEVTTISINLKAAAGGSMLELSRKR